MSFNCSDKCKAITCTITVVLAIILTLGFGIYGAVEYSNRNKYEDSSYTCGTFGNMTSLSMRKVLLSQWHWRYDAHPQGEDFGYFKQRCPTFTHDAKVFQDNKLSLVTDGKIVSLKSKVNILDCYGNLKYVIETGNLWQTIINSNKIWVSLLLKHPNGTLIAYVEQTIFVTGNIEFKEPSGKVIAAHVRKEIESLRWQWDYTVYDTSKINMDVLIAITAKVSFSPQAHNDKDSTDACNNFFMTTGIIALVFLILLVVGGLYYLYYRFCKKDDSNDSTTNYLQTNKNYDYMYSGSYADGVPYM
jgi:heme/copper-type cytochrome/quinol oxidase subunit 2